MAGRADMPVPRDQRFRLWLSPLLVGPTRGWVPFPLDVAPAAPAAAAPCEADSGVGIKGRGLIGRVRPSAVVRCEGGNDTGELERRRANTGERERERDRDGDRDRDREGGDCAGDRARSWLGGE